MKIYILVNILLTTKLKKYESKKFVGICHNCKNTLLGAVI